MANLHPERKPERGYIRMFPRNKNRNEGTFACSPGMKTGTRVHSPKPPFYATALLSPSDLWPFVNNAMEFLITYRQKCRRLWWRYFCHLLPAVPSWLLPISQHKQPRSTIDLVKIRSLLRVWWGCLPRTGGGSVTDMSVQLPLRPTSSHNELKTNSVM